MARLSRLPQVRIGNVELLEGSGGIKVARVPFKIIGAVTRPARFVAFTAGQRRGQVQRLGIDVAPGQTNGTIPIEYEADNVFGHDQQTSIALWPLRGIATDDYLGELRVLEDDPPPTIDVDVTRRVREGRPIRFTVTVEGRTSVTTSLFGRAVRGPGENLRGIDVPASWLEDHAEISQPRRPLWRLYASFYERIRPRNETVTVEIPTRRDGLREGPEFLYVRLEIGDRGHVKYRIRVLDGD